MPPTFMNSTKELTKEYWYSLEAYEQAELKSQLIQQNIVQGQMTRRAAQTQVRDTINRIENKETSRHQLGIGELLFRYKDDSLLNAIFPARKSLWTPTPKRTGDWTLNVENFSFIDHPIETFKTFKAMLYGEAQLPKTAMNFADRNVQDISSYMLLAIIYSRTNRFAWGGSMPESIQKVFKAVGLADSMKIGVPTRNSSDVFPFPLRSLKGNELTSENIGEQSSRKEKTASDITECIKEWLSLTPEKPKIDEEALSKIGNFVGEVLDNSERHSSNLGNGGWWIAGFMARRLSENKPDRYVCHIGVISLDQSIPETLLNSPDVVESRFFKHFRKYKAAGGKKLHDDLCACVLSVQDGVSCKPDYPDEPASGLGMGELINSVSFLGSGDGERKCAVTVISGRSCLHVKPPYMKATSETHWFNKVNSISDAPDSDRVKDIEFNFPGTIIAVRFELDSRHLNVIKSNDEEGNYVVRKVGSEWKLVPSKST